MTRHPYVVLHHTGHGPAHYDLMVATDADRPLLTWRLPAWPCPDPTTAEALPAHRRAYLTYEGVVSGGRGTVTRVDAGWCTIEEQTTQRLILSINEHRMTLHR